MKVIFDSNVWQLITFPDEAPPGEHFIPELRKIKQALLDKRIDGFLSETIFTIEAIKKAERQNFFSSTDASFKVTESVTDNGMISMNIQIGPNEKDAIKFVNRPILKKHFDEAVNMGLKIVPLPRIGGLKNPEVEKFMFKFSDGEFSSYFDKAVEVGQRIEDCGAGISQIEEIGMRYGERNFMKGLKHAPESEWPKIAKAAAEWADGDSVAIAVGLQCDYFCTRDQAKGAGNKSVLSEANLSWLGAEYGFKTITPEKLADFV